MRKSHRCQIGKRKSGGSLPASRARAGVVLSPTPRTDLKTIDDVRVEMAKVYRSVKAGEIDSQHGSRLVYILSQIGRLVEIHEIERRLVALESRLDHA